MVKNLFVGGLPEEMSQEELKKLFSTCGQVLSAKLIMNRDTGKSKCFGFVEMSTEAEAQAAINKLNNTQVGTRKMFVNEARPKEARPAGGFAPKPDFGSGRPSFGGGKPGGGKPGGKPSFDGDRPSFGDKRGGFGGKRGGKRGKRDDYGDYGDKRGGDKWR
jgi:RNA recognition motif-containing protein